MIEVSDIYLVACLLSYGSVIDRVDRTNPRHITFYLSTDGIHTIISENSNGSMLEITEPDVNRIISLFSMGKLWFPPDYPYRIKEVKAKLHRE